VLQPAFHALRSSRLGCLARHAGPPRGRKRRRPRSAARCRSSSGRLRCRVERGPASSGERGAIPAKRSDVHGGTHLGLRWARHPSRDDAKLEASRGWHTAFARCVGPVHVRDAEGAPPFSRARRHDTGCAAGSSGGFARRKPVWTSSRVGRSARRHASSGAVSARLGARVLAQAMAKSKRRRESKSPHAAARGPDARDHGPCLVVVQKSSGRPRAQRSAPSAAHGSKARARQEAGGRGPSFERSTARESARAARSERRTVLRSAAILIT